jgi:hypothetical protein
VRPHVIAASSTSAAMAQALVQLNVAVGPVEAVPSEKTDRVSESLRFRTKSSLAISDATSCCLQLMRGKGWRERNDRAPLGWHRCLPNAGSKHGSNDQSARSNFRFGDWWASQWAILQNRLVLQLDPAHGRPRLDCWRSWRNRLPLMCRQIFYRLGADGFGFDGRCRPLVPIIARSRAASAAVAAPGGRSV